MQDPLTRELADNGLSFSGGQLQRLALSRVLYEDHHILIMDEPASAMDVAFEKEFYDRVLQELRDQTVLFVSHRLTSAAVCDRILYMEGDVWRKADPTIRSGWIEKEDTNNCSAPGRRT